MIYKISKTLYIISKVLKNADRTTSYRIIGDEGIGTYCEVQIIICDYIVSPHVINLFGPISKSEMKSDRCSPVLLYTLVLRVP